MWILPVVLGAVFHVGGIPTKAEFLTPAALGEVADDSFTLSWRDNEQDLTGELNFFFQPRNARPPGAPTSPDFVGQSILADVAIIDPTNSHVWDTSAVPAGSYYLYEITRDEPLNPVVSLGPIPITVRHPGDPRFPAVIVDKPNGIGDTQGRRFPIRWRASGEGTLTARIRVQEKLADGEPESPWEEIATGVAMKEGDGGIHEGCHVWDVSAVPLANYVVEVEVTNEGGQAHAAYGTFPVVVQRDASNPETGAPPSCATTASGRDGGIILTPDGGPGDGGGGGFCTIATARRGRGPGSAALLVVLAGLLALAGPLSGRRGRRRAASGA